MAFYVRVLAIRALSAVILAAIMACASPSKGGGMRGQASWYGKNHHGRKTASGEPFDMHQLTAAHRTLPFGTRVRVRSLTTNKSVTVRINDRGPYAHGRIIDLSQEAARQLGILNKGEDEVELTSLGN